MSDTPYCTGCGYHAALLADHIEELEAENKRLRLEVAHANDTADAAIERMKELGAKLARAVEILEREICRVKQIQLDLPRPQKVGLFDVQMEYELMLKEIKVETDE